MKTVRQDAWTEEDDALLADIILRHIRQGSTQLLAFEEGAGILGRTPAACGYRWNACVRKHYFSAIDDAKRERKARKTGTAWVSLEENVSSNTLQTAVTWNMVVQFLHEYRHEFQTLQGHVKVLERDLEIAHRDVERLRKDRTELMAQLRREGEFST